MIAMKHIFIHKIHINACDKLTQRLLTKNAKNKCQYSKPTPVVMSYY